jgi:hypothetical protein
VGKEARGLQRDSEPVGGVCRGRGSPYGALHGGVTQVGRHNGDGVVWGQGDRLLVQEVVVRWCSPRGGGSQTGGRSEATLDGEAHGGCDCGAFEAHRGGAA